MVASRTSQIVDSQGIRCGSAAALDVRPDAELRQSESEAQADAKICWSQLEQGQLGDAVEPCTGLGASTGAETGPVLCASALQEVSLEILEQRLGVVPLGLGLDRLYLLQGDDEFMSCPESRCK